MNYSVFLQVATSVKVCTCYRAGEKKQMIEEVMYYINVFIMGLILILNSQISQLFSVSVYRDIPSLDPSAHTGHRHFELHVQIIPVLANENMILLKNCVCVQFLRTVTSFKCTLFNDTLYF